MREIPGYRPDIVMMQEVDRKMFRNGLKSVLGSHGMSGSLALKREVPEGLATFWRYVMPECFEVSYDGFIYDSWNNIPCY